MARVNGVEARCFRSRRTAFLDCFVIDRQLLLVDVRWYAATDYLDLFFETMANDYGRVNVQAYNFTDGYAAAIVQQKENYYQQQHGRARPADRYRALPRGRFIKTKAHDTSPPSLRCKGSHVTLTRSSPLAAASFWQRGRLQKYHGPQRHC